MPYVLSVCWIRPSQKPMEWLDGVMTVREDDEISIVKIPLYKVNTLDAAQKSLREIDELASKQKDYDGNIYFKDERASLRSEFMLKQINPRTYYHYIYRYPQDPAEHTIVSDAVFLNTTEARAEFTRRVADGEPLIFVNYKKVIEELI